MFSAVIFLSASVLRIGSITIYSLIVVLRNILLKKNVINLLLLIVVILNFSSSVRLTYYLKDTLAVALWLGTYYIGRSSRHSFSIGWPTFIICSVWIVLVHNFHSKEVLFLISALPLSHVLTIRKHPVWKLLATLTLIALYFYMDSLTMSLSLIIALFIGYRRFFLFFVISIAFLVFSTNLYDYLYHYLLESRFAPATSLIHEFSWYNHLRGLGSGFEIEIPWFNSGLWRHGNFTSPAIDSLFLTFYVKHGLLGVVVYVRPLLEIYRMKSQRMLFWFLLISSNFNAVSYQLFFPVLIYFYECHRRKEGIVYSPGTISLS